MRSDNPLYHAPACVSELHGEDRVRALAARDQAAREAYLARHRNPVRPSLVGRVMTALLG